MKEPAKQPVEQETISYRTPIYLQLREIVRNKIEDGEYLPGTAIPSENELAETYGINRITVRNAVDALVNEGVLRRVQGKGVFVVGNKMEQSLEEYVGFISSVNKDKSTVSVKEQTKMLRPAGDKFANMFNISPTDLIYYILHIVFEDSEPVSLEELFIPQYVIPQLDTVNSSVFHIHDVFAFYGISVSAVRQNLEIVECDAKSRKLLNVPDGVAMMMMKCTYQDDSGRIIEFNKSFTRSDKSSFKISLHKLNDY